MAQKITASMPEGMDLDFSYTIQYAALDPASGDAVAGVVVSTAAILATQLSAGGPAALAVAPVWVPVSLDALTGGGEGG